VPPSQDAFPRGDWQIVSSDALEALGERVVRGRSIAASDDAKSPPVALVNETIASTYWPGQDPIGRRIRQGGPARPWMTIVGVVADVRHNGLDVPVKGKYYRVHTQLPVTSNFAVRNMHLVVKAAGEPLSLAGAIRAEVARLDPALPVANIRTMEDVVATSISKPRLAGSVLLLFAALALLLAAIGLYGVLAFVVSERQHEIGIRMAIGAEARDVRRSVLGQGLALAGIGLAAGAAASVALGHAIRGLLHGVSPYDPTTFAAVPAVLLGVALVASWIPAHRATRISPMLALKSE
jgi:putative ABC transport system permease protein